MCPEEDEGLIRPMKSNPHFEKGKLERIGCKRVAKKFSFLVKI
jgi:hypothetical protein